MTEKPPQINQDEFLMLLGLEKEELVYRLLAKRPLFGPTNLDEVIREHMKAVLEACNGNQTHAADKLGIGRTTLYRWLKNKNATLERNGA